MQPAQSGLKNQVKNLPPKLLFYLQKVGRVKVQYVRTTERGVKVLVVLMVYTADGTCIRG